MRSKPVTRLLAIGMLCAAPLTGCASADMDQLRSDINDARAVADAAKQEAEAARNAAADAKAAAEAAKAAADEARAAAQANGDKIDRMFKKAMSK